MRQRQQPPEKMCTSCAIHSTRTGWAFHPFGLVNQIFQWVNIFKKEPCKWQADCTKRRQDGTCFVAGTTAGFRVFMTDGAPDSKGPASVTERLRRDPGPQPRSSVMRVAMLMRSSIFAMVIQTFEASGEAAPGCMAKVAIWEERKQKVVAELRSRNEVKSVYLHKAGGLGISHQKILLLATCGACLEFFGLFLHRALSILFLQ